MLWYFSYKYNHTHTHTSHVLTLARKSLTHTHTCTQTALIKLSSDKELVSKWETDQETMKSMQIRVGLSTKVRPIIVRVPGRLLLQESEVTIVEKRRKKKVCYAFCVCVCVCVCV